MRKSIVHLAAVMLIVAAAGVAQASVEPQLLAQVDAEVKEKKKKPKRECRRVRVTGSRVKERVCKSPEEWGRVDDNVRENVDRAFEGSTRATGGGET